MIRLIKVSVISLFIILVCGLSFAEEKIIVSGTGDSQHLLRILAKHFEKSHPGTQIEIPDSIGSSGGIKATALGKCDLGRVARPLKEKEKKYNLHYKEFAISPVVFAANASVTSVDNLTFQQVLDIYSGKITLWSQLGGENGKIYVANREPGDSSLSVLKKKIPGFKNIKTYAGKILYSTPETLDTLSKYRNTIGYGPLSMTKGRNLTIMKVEGLYPSAENVQQEKYKLVAPFGLVWKGKLTGLAKIFFDFLFTPEAKGIISKNGAVPVIS